jgi:hypothetical protein
MELRNRFRGIDAVNLCGSLAGRVRQTRFSYRPARPGNLFLASLKGFANTGSGPDWPIRVIAVQVSPPLPVTAVCGEALEAPTEI